MANHAIFWPMFVLVLFTFGIALRMFLARKAAIQSGQVRLSHFRAFTEGNAPESMAKVGRAFANLAEVPPLFYAVCIVIMVLSRTDDLFVLLAWAYVACRVIQGLIHVTYNNVMHRALAYFASWFVLLAMWIRLALQLA